MVGLKTRGDSRSSTSFRGGAVKEKIVAKQKEDEWYGKKSMEADRIFNTRNYAGTTLAQAKQDWESIDTRVAAGATYSPEAKYEAQTKAIEAKIKKADEKYEKYRARYKKYNKKGDDRRADRYKAQYKGYDEERDVLKKELAKIQKNKAFVDTGELFRYADDRGDYERKKRQARYEDNKRQAEFLKNNPPKRVVTYSTPEAKTPAPYVMEKKDALGSFLSTGKEADYAWVADTKLNVLPQKTVTFEQAKYTGSAKKVDKPTSTFSLGGAPSSKVSEPTSFFSGLTSEKAKYVGPVYTPEASFMSKKQLGGLSSKPEKKPKSPLDSIIKPVAVAGLASMATSKTISPMQSFNVGVELTPKEKEINIQRNIEILGRDESYKKQLEASPETKASVMSGEVLLSESVTTSPAFAEIRGDKYVSTTAGTKKTLSFKDAKAEKNKAAEEARLRALGGDKKGITEKYTARAEETLSGINEATKKINALVGTKESLVTKSETFQAEQERLNALSREYNLQQQRLNEESKYAQTPEYQSALREYQSEIDTKRRELEKQQAALDTKYGTFSKEAESYNVKYSTLTDTINKKLLKLETNPLMQKSGEGFKSVPITTDSSLGKIEFKTGLEKTTKEYSSPLDKFLVRTAEAYGTGPVAAGERKSSFTTATEIAGGLTGSVGTAIAGERGRGIYSKGIQKVGFDKDTADILATGAQIISTIPVGGVVLKGAGKVVTTGTKFLPTSTAGTVVRNLGTKVGGVTGLVGRGTQSAGAAVTGFGARAGTGTIALGGLKATAADGLSFVGRGLGATGRVTSKVGEKITMGALRGGDLVARSEGLATWTGKALTTAGRGANVKSATTAAGAFVGTTEGIKGISAVLNPEQEASRRRLRSKYGFDTRVATGKYIQGVEDIKTSETGGPIAGVGDWLQSTAIGVSAGLGSFLPGADVRGDAEVNRYLDSLGITDEAERESARKIISSNLLATQTGEAAGVVTGSAIIEKLGQKSFSKIFTRDITKGLTKEQAANRLFMTGAKTIAPLAGTEVVMQDIIQRGTRGKEQDLLETIKGVPTGMLVGGALGGTIVRRGAVKDVLKLKQPVRGTISTGLDWGSNIIDPSEKLGDLLEGGHRYFAKDVRPGAIKVSKGGKVKTYVGGTGKSKTISGISAKTDTRIKPTQIKSQAQSFSKINELINVESKPQVLTNIKTKTKVTTKPTVQTKADVTAFAKTETLAQVPVMAKATTQAKTTTNVKVSSMQEPGYVMPPGFSGNGMGWGYGSRSAINVKTNKIQSLLTKKGMYSFKKGNLFKKL